MATDRSWVTIQAGVADDDGARHNLAQVNRA